MDLRCDLLSCRSANLSRQIMKQTSSRRPNRFLNMTAIVTVTLSASTSVELLDIRRQQFQWQSPSPSSVRALPPVRLFMTARGIHQNHRGYIRIRQYSDESEHNKTEESYEITLGESRAALLCSRQSIILWILPVHYCIIILLHRYCSPVYCTGRNL